MTKRRGSGLSASEAAELVAGYEKSGLPRREYCAALGIPVTTFDYYRRRPVKKRENTLVPVEVIERPAAAGRGFALVLANGRRIESEWGFAAEELAELVRVAERA